MAGTIQTWWPAILVALTEDASNARTEGFNRIIKQTKRVGCGYRNMINYQRRILSHIAVTRSQQSTAGRGWAGAHRHEASWLIEQERDDRHVAIRRRDGAVRFSYHSPPILTVMPVSQRGSKANRGSEVPTTARIVMALDRVGRAGIGTSSRRKRVRSL